MRLLLVIFLMSIGFFTHAQNVSLKNELKEKLIRIDENDSFAKENSDFVVTHEHISQQSKIHHIYFSQANDGVKIIGTESSIHLNTKGETISYNLNFVKSISQQKADPKITALQAAEYAGIHLHNNSKNTFEILEKEQSKNQKQLLSRSNLSKQSIPAELVYSQDGDELILVWNLFIVETTGTNSWTIKIDANDGKEIHRESNTHRCNPGLARKDAEHLHLNKFDNSLLSSSTTNTSSYNVYPLPISDPSDGNRSIVSDPYNMTASPFGWHDVDGVSGAEYTITRGNNIYAIDNESDYYSPDGGSALNFDFPLDLDGSLLDNKDAAIANAFYWSNLAHDIFYNYGFDEISGNYQENNYGNGGLEGDYVVITNQNRSDCGPQLITFEDGYAPTMYLQTCEDRDGGFNHTTLIHEYGHGVVRRLTGGASTVRCLSGSDGMEEGWCDFFGLVLTIEASDTRTMTRAYGDWYYDLTNGIRRLVYNTDLTANDATLGDASVYNQVHESGHIWGSILWDMTWDLIDVYGFDSDVINGQGGNNIAIQLVVEALKLQPCKPGFVDARDAILAADQAIYGGANQCLIWNTFATRGLGFSADQGSNLVTGDEVEAFDLPASCGNSSCDVDFEGANSITVSSEASQGNILTINGSQEWVASSNDPWIVIDNNTGTNNGTLSYSLSRNAIRSERIGKILITCSDGSNSFFTIKQELFVCNPAYANIPYATGFESGEIEDNWCFSSSVEGGRVQIVSTNTPNSGNNHLAMDKDNLIYGLFRSYNRATVGLDLTGEEDVILEYWLKSYGNFFSDGVFFANSGGPSPSYIKVAGFENTSDYTKFTLNVSELAAENNLELNSTFSIQFRHQSFDPVPTSGILIDDVSIYSATCLVGDTDADGVCDADDVCAGFDDTIDSDGDGIPDGCDDCDDTLIGTSCDDGDVCTTGDVFDANCNCAGALTDTDGDGVCDTDDVCAGFDDTIDSDGDGIPDGCDDCDDTLTGTSCDDDDVCTEGDVFDANCNCAGTLTDTDGDGVCDTDDVCAGFDDTIDTDGDGVPDGCDFDCVFVESSFPDNPLTHTGGASSSTTISFSGTTTDASFTISGINQRTSGKGSRKYIEEVTVSFVNASGNTMTYGVFSGAEVNSVDIFIEGGVQMISVSLADIYDGSTQSIMSINLSLVDHCAEPCADSDNDEVCDEDDMCPGFDDNIDSDGDNIPDECDLCNNVTTSFNPTTLVHSGQGASSTNLEFVNHKDIAFTITNLGAKTGGNPNSRYIDLVEVLYEDANGVEMSYGVFSGSQVNSANIFIEGVVTSVTVLLSDNYDGNSRAIDVNLSDVSSCLLPQNLLDDNIESISVKTIDQITDVHVFPVPFSSSFNIVFESSIKEDLDIYLTDAFGKIVLHKTTSAGIGKNYLAMEGEHLHNGIYILVVKNNSFKYVSRIIKVGN